MPGKVDAKKVNGFSPTDHSDPNEVRRLQDLKQELLDTVLVFSRDLKNPDRLWCSFSGTAVKYVFVREGALNYHVSVEHYSIPPGRREDVFTRFFWPRNWRK